MYFFYSEKVETTSMEYDDTKYLIFIKGFWE